MSEGYTRDHLNVLKALGKDAPKRTQMTTEEVVKAQFKDKGDKGDRVVRNAYRKLRDRGLIEIADRGMYRLTQAGVKMYQTLKEKGVGGILQERKATPKKAKAKKTGKKEAKKATPKKAKPKAKPAVKKAAPKAKPKTTTAKAAKAPEKHSDKPKAPGNGKPASKLSAALPKKAEKAEEKPAEKPATLPM